MGANVPFGLVQLGPTEPTRGWDWCSGYYYDDDELIGFGHMHLSGTGIGCLGDVAFLPVKDFKQTSTRFKHEAEKVHPGYYSVQLTDPNVLVELTATERCGFHRYTFKNGAKAQLALDLSQCIGWDKLNDASPVSAAQTVGQPTAASISLSTSRSPSPSIVSTRWSALSCL